MPLKIISQTAIDVYRAPAYNLASRSVVVHNTDTTNLVYYDKAPGTIDDRSAFIEPLGSEVFDGADDVWMSTLDPAISVTVQVKIGSRSYAAGIMAINGNVNAVVSGNVNVTNTPNVNVTGTASVDITGSSVTVDVAGNGGVFPIGSNALLQTIPANSSVPALGQFVSNTLDLLNYTSFDITGSLYCASQGTLGAPLCAPVYLVWYADAAATQIVYQQQGALWITNTASSSYPFTISGPCHARYLQVQFINLASVAGYNILYGYIFGTGRSLVQQTWTQFPPYASLSSGVTIVPPSGFENANLPGTIIGYAMPASSTRWYPLFLVNQRATLRFKTSAVLSVDACIVAAPGNLQNGNITSGTGAKFCIWDIPNVANTSQGIDIELPPMPCYLTLLSTATAPSIDFSAVTTGTT